MYHCLKKEVFDQKAIEFSKLPKEAKKKYKEKTFGEGKPSDAKEPLQLAPKDISKLRACESNTSFKEGRLVKMRIESETRKKDTMKMRREKVKDMLLWFKISVLSVESIIVPVNIQMWALWLVEDCFRSSHNCLARGDYGEVIITGALNLYYLNSCFLFSKC